MAKPPKYPFPEFLAGVVTPEKYRKWLYAKTNAHIVRDRKRGNVTATGEEYRIAIHDAVVRCGGSDEYTGEALDWHLIGTYENAGSKEGKRVYKAGFALLPTVDHLGDGVGPAEFAIASWRTNDAKADLTHEEFVKLCRLVVANYDRRLDEAKG